jgi:DNA-binding transcriptional LysR family regulator
MNPKQIRSIVTVHQLGSIAKAAQQLHLAPSSISQQIKEVSQELGVDLFEAQGRGMVLTDVGHQLLERFQQFLILSKDIKLQAQTSHGQLKGAITLFAPSSMCIYRLPPLIEALQARAPEIELVLIHEPFDYEAALNSREIDAAITVSQYPDSKWLSHKLCDEPIIYVCHPETHLNEALSVEALQKKALITTEPNCTYRLAAENHFHAEHFSLHPKQTFSNVEVIKRCLFSNMGIGLLPECVVQEELDKGRLKHQTVIGTPYPFQSYLLISKSRPMTPKLQALIDAIQSLSMNL